MFDALRVTISAGLAEIFPAFDRFEVVEHAQLNLSSPSGKCVLAFHGMFCDRTGSVGSGIIDMLLVLLQFATGSCRRQQMCLLFHDVLHCVDCLSLHPIARLSLHPVKCMSMHRDDYLLMHHVIGCWTNLRRTRVRTPRVPVKQTTRDVPVTRRCADVCQASAHVHPKLISSSGPGTWRSNQLVKWVASIGV